MAEPGVGVILVEPDYIDKGTVTWRDLWPILATAVLLLALCFLAGACSNHMDRNLVTEVVLTDGTTLRVTNYRQEPNWVMGRALDGDDVSVPNCRVHHTRTTWVQVEKGGG